METIWRSWVWTTFGTGQETPGDRREYLFLFFCAFLGCLILVVMGYFTPKNQFPLNEKTAIVTGGSQGLGLSAAKLLASKGANVVIVAQDVPKLEAAIEEIKQCAKNLDQRFFCLSFDLRSPKSAPEILYQVTKWNSDIPPSIVWCCAGHCIPGFFANTSIDTLRGQMDTIYWSAAYMAHAALNHWLRSPPVRADKASKQHSPTESRHIIFTSSTLAFFPLAGYAPYSPAKAAMKSLSDTLVQEIAMHNAQYSKQYSASPFSHNSGNIKIHTLFPMGILTPGYENENKLKPPLTLMLEKDDKPQHPDEVARIAVERLEKGEYLITTMFLGHLLRGIGMGASLRNGLVDLVWSMLGGLAVLFVVPDFVGKCRKWGEENVEKDKEKSVKDHR